MLPVRFGPSLGLTAGFPLTHSSFASSTLEQDCQLVGRGRESSKWPSEAAPEAAEEGAVAVDVGWAVGSLLQAPLWWCGCYSWNVRRP